MSKEKKALTSGEAREKRLISIDKRTLIQFLLHYERFVKTKEQVRPFIDASFKVMPRFYKGVQP